MSRPKVDMEALREQIDQIDTKIVELLSRRANVVVEVGKLKNADQEPIYAPDREKQVLDRVRELNRGPLSNHCLEAIYRELMSGSIALERPQKIAYLGPEGSFSHLAATAKFGASVEYEPVLDIRTVFHEVARGHADFGLVPIENSIGGGVVDTLDAFIESNVQICAEVIRTIRHNLLANCAQETITKIYSKPEVFSQCRSWLAGAMPGIDTVPVASTSRAAELASEEEAVGAIGSVLAARLYGLKVVSADIEDNPNNVTRFFVIGREPAKRTGDDKTALMFTTSHQAGALVEVLNIFARSGINLTNIDTRPSKKRHWEYYFFLDAEGHIDNENMQTATQDARRHCLQLEVLGSFPRATEIN